MPSDYKRITGYNEEQLGKDTASRKTQICMYSDPTHFVYELLQNADDYAASEVVFQLLPDRLVVEHNGEPFTTKHVEAISYIGKSTSREDLVKTGRFGLGFKSVFAFTSTPAIYSGDEHFEILGLYRLREVEQPRDLSAERTRIVLPFDHEEQKPDYVESYASAAQAVDQIRRRLRELEMETLLFTRKIREVRWEVKTGEERCSGHYLREDTEREEYSTSLRQRTTTIINGGALTYVVFERPVLWEGQQHKPVEIAFPIDDDDRFGKDAVRAFVLFATEHYPSMGFVVNGPYRTTPNRESIAQEDEFNRHLVRETAQLLADALPVAREMGMITVDFLETLPLRPSGSSIDGMFAPLFERTRKELTDTPLLPAAHGGHVAGKDAKLARGEDLVALLSPDQLSELLRAPGRVTWLSTEITERREDLYRYLVGKKRSRWSSEWEIEPLVQDVEVEAEDIVGALSRAFLVEQTDEWLCRFYAYMRAHRALWDDVKGKPIVRLQDGRHVRPGEAFLHPEEDRRSSFPTVRRALLQDEEAVAFLRDLGLTEPSIVDEVREFIIPKYRDSEEAMRIDWEIHWTDVDEIVRALRVDSESKRKQLEKELEELPFLWAVRADGKEQGLKSPGELYIESDELRMYFDGNPNAWFVDSRYDDEQIGALAAFGLDSEVFVACRERRRNGYVTISDGWGWHSRGVNGFDPEADIDGLQHALNSISAKKAVYIWNELLCPNVELVRGIVESSPRQEFPSDSTERTERLSKIGKLVTEKSWLPDSEGGFRRPSEVALSELPESFRRDERLAKQLNMKSDVLQQAAEEYGVSPDELREAIDIRKDPNGWREFQEWRAERKTAGGFPEFPESASADRQRRQERVKRGAGQAARKKYEKGQRSVRTSGPDRQPEPYLRALYTNRSGEMVCQICRREMPFKKPDNEYYFEAVELFTQDQVPTEHGQLYAALCPVCAAKYKVFVKNDAVQGQEVLGALRGGEDPEILLELDGNSHSIRFVSKHLTDIQAILGEVAR